ncbi:MAG: HPr family phosphocarrier protein [Enterocloster sp.]
MKHIYVKFNQSEEIVKFVRIMNRYEYEAYVKCGSRMVDAKSIVGVLALAKSKTVELILHTNDDCSELMEELAPFAA